MSSKFNSITSKKLTIFVILAVPFCAVIFLMIAAGSGQVTQAPTQAKIHKVFVQPSVLETSHQQKKMVYGQVESSTQSNLGFELSGKVIDVFVDEGDVLTPNMLLAKLDISRLEASKAEINASLARTQADLRLAKLSLKRVTELVAKNLESQQKLDEVTELTSSAAALVKEIQAKKSSLQLEVEKSSLYASENSIVVSRPIDRGSVVAVGQTVFSVQHENTFEVRIGMPQDQAFALQVGQIHTLYYSDQALTGKIKSIAKQRKRDTRTIDVIFNIEIPHNLPLLSGDLVAFEYSQNTPEAGVWVDKQALTSGIRGLWTIFVVPSTGQHTVNSKSVEILYAEKNKVFVRGNIAPSDWLVVSGGHRLVPGQLVQAVASNTTSSQ
ncbi:efflux RND transporter periplasmic adaptor subunit [Paraglaciecola sp.]|uniref:efflux RND transporter periplasmic adaptor subunit n=1 Tax=Paraglaciecola sp. TaxID=1920173 RepID=UPI003EF7A151